MSAPHGRPLCQKTRTGAARPICDASNPCPCPPAALGSNHCCQVTIADVAAAGAALHAALFPAGWQGGPRCCVRLRPALPTPSAVARAGAALPLGACVLPVCIAAAAAAACVPASAPAPASAAAAATTAARTATAAATSAGAALPLLRAPFLLALPPQLIQLPHLLLLCTTVVRLHVAYRADEEALVGAPTLHWPLQVCSNAFVCAGEGRPSRQAGGGGEHGSTGGPAAPFHALPI